MSTDSAQHFFTSLRIDAFICGNKKKSHDSTVEWESLHSIVLGGTTCHCLHASTKARSTARESLGFLPCVALFIRCRIWPMIQAGGCGTSANMLSLLVRDYSRSPTENQQQYGVLDTSTGRPYPWPATRVTCPPDKPPVVSSCT
ncbi:hypothetical protein IF1G_02213 [Cordyceps javanica]|uniref:Uncharacterized protein n=1 Tax=Cordyceps javanica TaxID=43265 RepID=A0A545VE59_9HYPO|nr:hypothetical protein IF1G_02213 [Cordyceps javanica]